MAKIIYIKSANARKFDLVRFVKSYRKSGFFRKERIEYTTNVLEAMELPEDVNFYDEEVRMICERAAKDMPETSSALIRLEDFTGMFSANRFWLIENAETREYFSDINDKTSVAFTQDIKNARLILVRGIADETLTLIRRNHGGKVLVREVYLNLQNLLLTPTLVMVCMGKKDGNIKYFKRLDGNTVRMVSTSAAARIFTYEDAIATFEYLKANNKHFWYSVIPAPKDNVKAVDVEDYMRDNKISRQVAVDMKIKWLEKK